MAGKRKHKWTMECGIIIMEYWRKVKGMDKIIGAGKCYLLYHGKQVARVGRESRKQG